MSSRSVYLTTLFLGQISLLSGWAVFVLSLSFARNWQMPFLNQRKGENDCRKYFMINLHEKKCCQTRQGSNPLLITSQTRIRLSGQGRQEQTDLTSSVTNINPDQLAYLQSDQDLCWILTFTTLWAFSADEKLLIFFLFFPKNRIWYFMQIVSLGHMSYPVFR